MLVIAEGDDGVDFGGAMGGEPGGDEGDDRNGEGGGEEGEGVGGAEAEELAVVESNGTVRVVGLPNEAYALRRYAAASDLRRRELTGTI